MDNYFLNNMLSQQSAKTSLLCVGLDPEYKSLPEVVKKDKYPIFSFNKAIIEATQDIACCYKPQIAHYSALGAEKELELTIQFIKDLDIPVLLDAKRGDIGNTSEMYARELFERYDADAVTVNPYLGMDSMEPYLSRSNKTIFILCRTSNPGSANIQNLTLEDGEKLYERVAKLAATEWNFNDNVGLVVGATNPVELKRVREIVGEMSLLLPGVGTQGADIEATMTANGKGNTIITSSRAILFASPNSNFSEAARAVALRTRNEINRYHQSI